MDKLPRIAITPGEPAGIGPDLVLALAGQPVPAEVVAVTDPELLEIRAGEIGANITLQEWQPGQAISAHEPGSLHVVPEPLAGPVRPGRLDRRNAPYVVNALDRAIKLCRNGACDALVTGPVQKSVINEAGIAFTGHTEWLAERTHAPRPVMLLTSPELRVALVTTHIPLSRVAGHIRAADLATVIRTLNTELHTRFGIDRPRLLATGLNPHAGEQGHLGDEEQRIIQPTIETLQREGVAVEGPVPADTAFTPARLDHVDAVLTMYHDQGLPVIKARGFGRTVNVTLGLPIIRTSVDHGTALDLAGTGHGDPASLAEAVRLATTLAGNAG